MNQSDPEVRSANSDEVSVKDVILKIKSTVAYLKKKFVVIISVSLITGLCGVTYAIFKKPLYTATCTFVLADGMKGGGLGQYAGLASLVGIDMGAGGGSIFQSDNIIELYKSRLMIEKALLSRVLIDGKNDLLIHRYAEFSGLKKRWRENKKIGDINFYGDAAKFNRTQDSIIKTVVNTINAGVLSVLKPDKKLNMVVVSVTSTDELFSKAFADKIVETVNSFYVQTRTKKELQNVQLLQRQADSIKIILNSSIAGVASAIDAAPNANPALLALRVPSQKRQIDVQANSSIYAEIVKNLEISKISLRQETPLIQVIDAPVLPLDDNHLGKLKGGFIGFIIGALAAIAYFTLSRLYAVIMR